MSRFNYTSKTTCTLLCLSLLTTAGCRNHDTPRQADPVRVEVVALGATSVDRQGDATYSGTVESGETSVPGFNVAGIVTQIYVKEGQQVTKGQVIARLKAESLGNERNIAVAELEEVRDAYNRFKKLHDANALPDVKWVEIQSKLKQAENAVALADRAVSDATLTAPISGYVAEKMVDVGQTVIPAQPVVRIVNTGNLQISVAVPENDIDRFSGSPTATVTFDALDDLTVNGKLTEKAVVADPLTRSYTVKFNIPSSGSKILPGMIGNVTVKGLAVTPVDSTGTATVIYTLPSQAVLLGSDNRQFVWTVKDGKAQRCFVSANELTAGGVRVTDGLHDGDSVIVAGMQKVGTGTVVNAVVKH